MNITVRTRTVNMKAWVNTYPMSNRNSCDFCLSAPVLKGYQCDSFSLNGVPLFSGGSSVWMACSECAELVDAEQWSTLADRAYGGFAQSHEVARHEESQVRIELSKVIAQFAVHRKR
jgi:hypothetical protein